MTSHRLTLDPGRGRIKECYVVGGAMAGRPAILVVDADVDWCGALEHGLGPHRVRCLRASSAAEALETLDGAGAAGIAAILSEHALPGPDGIDLLVTARRRWPRIARVLLGPADLAAAARAVNEAAVDRLILKPVTAAEVAAIVRDLLDQRWRPAREPDGSDSSAGLRLTPRERQVLAWLGQGASNAEIAQALHLTPGSARIYVKRVLAKLGVRDRTKAALQARALGLAAPVVPSRE